MFLFSAAIAATLAASSPVFAGDLSALLKEFSLTDEEKKETTQYLTPRIEIESQKIRRCYVRIEANKGIYLSTPVSATDAKLTRVYLNVEDGGLYVEEISGATRFLELLKSPDKETKQEKKAEHDFLRQFGYLLRQRHPKDPSTIRFFKRYFPVAAADKFSVVDGGENRLDGLFADFDPMEQVFHFMQKPSEWTGDVCNEERCLFNHPEMGTMALLHPGSAELILDPDELVGLDPAEQKAPPLAPEISTRGELEGSLNALPPQVSKAYVLITHSKCPPCQALKREGGAWNKFCRLLRRVRSGKVAALMESTEGEQITASNLMGSYSLPGVYPQMLVFERDANGVWQEPQTIASDKIAETLKAE